jgi:hypothetical protein
VTAWDAFHREGPFVGSGGEAAFTRLPRSRDRRSAFRAKLRPVNGVLTPPWASADPLPQMKGEGSTCRHPFARRARRRVTADARPGLGPRSLSPRSLFEGAARERIRDQMSPRTTSATAFRRAGTPTGTLVILEGTEAATSFLF